MRGGWQRSFHVSNHGRGFFRNVDSSPRCKTVAPLALAFIAVLALGGCGFFPHDGPSIDAVRDGATGTKGSYSLVELDPRAAAIVESVPLSGLAGLTQAASVAPVDLIGIGDGLSVTVFERSPSALFGAGGMGGGATSAGGGLDSMSVAVDRSASSTVPRVVVDARGDITLPYAGNVHVAGLRVAQAEQAIAISLKRAAIDPQVVLSVVDNVANSVTIVGEVHAPGRYALSPGSDHLLDVLALAAGAARIPEDTKVIVVRGSMSASISLAELMRDNSQNIRLAPRDQIRLIYAPRKFTAFGAFVHPTEFVIADQSLNLAEAFSLAGGLDPAQANASAVLLFRFERPNVAAALSVRAPVSARGVPIIYHLNLRDPEALFIANQFEVQPNDLVYVPRAGLIETEQFIGIVNAASSVAYNVRVTSAVVP
jgi:polysaccharide export outer membrane protein